MVTEYGMDPRSFGRLTIPQLLLILRKPFKTSGVARSQEELEYMVMRAEKERLDGIQAS